MVNSIILNNQLLFFFLWEEGSDVYKFARTIPGYTYCPSLIIKKQKQNKTKTTFTVNIVLVYTIYYVTLSIYLHPSVTSYGKKMFPSLSVLGLDIAFPSATRIMDVTSGYLFSPGSEIKQRHS